MKNGQNSFAYIDGANLHNAIKEIGWSLDYGRFRIAYLNDQRSILGVKMKKPPMRTKPH